MQETNTPGSNFTVEQTRVQDDNSSCSSSQEHIAPGASCVTWDEKAEIVESEAGNCDINEVPEMAFDVDVQEMNLKVISSAIENRKWNIVLKKDVKCQTKWEVERTDDGNIVSNENRENGNFESYFELVKVKKYGLLYSMKPLQRYSYFWFKSYNFPCPLFSNKENSENHAPNAGLGVGDEICNGSQAESVICYPSSSGSTVSDMLDPANDGIITSVNDSQNTQTEFSVVHPVGKMSIGHDDESEPVTSTKTGVLEPRNGHQCISYQKIPPATINEKIGNGSTVNLLTSPPLEQKKLSSNPIDGFETSKLTISPPLPSFPNASIAWTGETSGKFSVRSAYKLSLGEIRGEEDPVWRAVNRYEGLQKIRIFLWLVCNEKLMTNGERLRRHFTNIGSCPLCGFELEDVNHVLRTCPNVISIWYSLIRQDQMQRFLSMPLREWVLENLKAPERFSTAASWELLFGAVLWNIWLARNAVVFKSSSCLSIPIIQSSKLLVERTRQAYGDVRGFVQAGSPNAATIKWSPPEDGWFKLNTDGATRQQDGLSTCGGVLRAHSGSWSFGFFKFIGFCSVFEAELWGEDCRQGHLCSLLFHIRSFLQRNWEVHVVHVSRSANSVADRLAKLAIPGNNCVTYLANPPPSIVPMLQGDIASHLVPNDPLYVS
ncbi:hypothetical protein GQ457_03G036380 [Hibiscus cannabinus]